jgi:hypothetical protein
VNVKQLVLCAFVAFLSSEAIAQEVTNNKFGKGLINIIAKDSSYSLNFTARFQALYTAGLDIPEFETAQDLQSSFLIRRARLKFEGFAYSPKLWYKLQLTLSNPDMAGASVYNGNTPMLISDAFVRWNFHKNFELWVGQTKLPGNRERMISSGSLETVDRSLSNSNFNLDRDMGLQLRGRFPFGKQFLVRSAVAFTQGEGRNITVGNLGGYQITSRAEALPFGDFNDYEGADFAREPKPKLSIGASYDFNGKAVKTRSVLGNFMETDTGLHETDITTVFVDAMFKYKGWSAMVEYAKRTADDPVARNLNGSETGDVVNVGNGFNIQTSYLFKKNYQVTARYTAVELDREVFENGVEKQYTLGFSKYFVGHKLKIQSDISLNDFENDISNRLLYRLQFEIQF